MPVLSSQVARHIGCSSYLLGLIVLMVLAPLIFEGVTDCYTLLISLYRLLRGSISHTTGQKRLMHSKYQKKPGELAWR